MWNPFQNTFQNTGRIAALGTLLTALGACGDAAQRPRQDGLGLELLLLGPAANAVQMRFDAPVAELVSMNDVIQAPFPQDTSISVYP